LRKDAPVITHADVRFTGTNDGSVGVGWSKPTELDTVAFPSPYQYRVYRSPGFYGGAFDPAPIAIFNDLNDTSYVDTLIDTKTQPWSYKIELYYTDTVLKLKGQTAVASTVFLRIAPTDNALVLNWEEHVPWINRRYDVFKQNAAFLFDSIASVNVPTYTDTGLVNGTQYCYYIRASGTYFFSGFIDPLINRSQQECGVPYDNVPPCAPDLNVNSDCKNNLNQLVWNNPNNTCSDDVLGYKIYFGSSISGNYELIDSVSSPDDTVYVHDNLVRISGCYKVTAVDSVGNETMEPLAVCVDTCRQYVLPSVFTPNGDFKNDLFHPCDSTTAIELQESNCPPYKNVKRVDFKIFNRWGNLVYQTEDKNINWDGKHKDTKKDCPEGVYFYTCKVYFFSISGEQVKELHGAVQLIRNN
jgi:gliding motility-associated-like protein